MTHPLRDLAAKIERVCAEHESYSQGHAIVDNCVNHLCAVARTHEVNYRLLELERLVDVAAQKIYKQESKDDA